jgi:hypothetical protein
VAGRISSIEKYSDLIGNRTRDLPACSINILVHSCTVLAQGIFSAKFVCAAYDVLCLIEWMAFSMAGLRWKNRSWVLWNTKQEC